MLNLVFKYRYVQSSERKPLWLYVTVFQFYAFSILSVIFRTETLCKT
jgi:hypothetical protein